MASYKPRKPQSNQKLISSFFSSGPKTASVPLITGESSHLSTPPTSRITPEKSLKLKHVSTNLSQLSSKRNRSAFDEIGSSDTSFDSPEITNFCNPVLSRFSSNLGGSPEDKKDKKSGSSQQRALFISSDSEDDKENINVSASFQSNSKTPLAQKPALKRVASPGLFDRFNGQPKKVLRKQNSSQTSTVAYAESFDIVLSDEQRNIVDTIVNKGENVFFSGSAGTGKSIVLRKLVGDLNRKYGQFAVGVTASTGLAACNIQGQTLHKFLSIGLGTGSPQDLAIKIKKNGSAKKRWSSLAVLVIDEISMIDGTLFSKIDEIAKIIRRNQKPFGGIQIVCSGDFYQLPPVSKNNTSQYCFQSPSWKKAMTRTFILTKVFRQKGDNQLIDTLNALREGSFSQETVEMFLSLRRKVTYTDGIEPTELFPTRMEVKRANETRLRQLEGQTVSFLAKDNDNSPQAKVLFENLMCETKLDLKVGAQVMYLKNHTDGMVVNGSIGTVIAFLPEDLFSKIFTQFHPTDFLNASPEFIKSVTLVCSLIGAHDYSEEQRGIFETLPEIYKQKVTKLAYEAFHHSKSQELLPLVNFKTGDDDFTMILVRREEFTVDSGRMLKPQGVTSPDMLMREQVPLLLAWAMSIHKAQGQSIDRLRVDLRRTFEKGQVYVALSRATNKDHLEVLNFDHRRISISEEVKNFYKSLRMT